MTVALILTPGVATCTALVLFVALLMARHALNPLLERPNGAGPF